MIINNYAVAMNSQYFNLQRDYTDVSISTSDENFQGDDSLEVEESQAINSIEKESYNKLSQELSMAVLKNIDYETSRSTREVLEMSYTYEEHQSLNFQVQAYLQTDSKEIALDLNIALSRSFVQHTNISIESLQALKDPLILSFDGTMPSLSSKTFSFDIDSDGESDQISQLNAGNGFLALDKNNNHIIDDGSELFGTKSGNGFEDLAKYDEDKNGWIDENDAVFDKLRVWQKNEGKDTLLALGELGIGAIFLGDAATPFELKSRDNSLLGEIKKSGFFVYENGSAGVISQVDLAVRSDLKDLVHDVEELQNNLSALNTYKEDSKNSDETEDTRIEKIQEEIQKLEVKLSKAKEDEKAVFQAQIAVLFSQLMSMIENEFT